MNIVNFTYFKFEKGLENLSGDVITNYILPYLAGNEILYLVYAAPTDVGLEQKVQQNRKGKLICAKGGKDDDCSFEKIVLISGDNVLGIAQIVIFFCF